ncbi:hypothetical protein N7478_011063 [Penicillium angulare]|uniref:uncharacterized protein n=1 Tax=Penicillium angulare TaxID=116970 RepID=UPI002541C109|nr:uncharacterized protein N7478_011063 [Penicillium angulare]KAJ5263458.1 hypothetical protein N7478_011063 [Penicillium angulare]
MLSVGIISVDGFGLIISGLSAANISFYVQTGAEIHWRQAHWFHRDAASIKTLLTGLTGLVIGEIIFTIAAYVLTPYIYNFVHAGVSVFQYLFAPLFSKYWKWKGSKSDNNPYEQVAIKDWDEESNVPETESMLGLQSPGPAPGQPTKTGTTKKVISIFVASAATYVLTLCVIRPYDAAYDFLSQTVVITPFVKPPTRTLTSSFYLPDLPGDYSWLYNHTAIGPTSKYDWMPVEKTPGFRDWYEGFNGSVPQHYDPNLDPIHLSNLDADIIEPLRETLKDGKIKIKHVFLFKLESTRSDVFPVKKDGHIADIIRKSYSGEIPDEVEDRLANLTRNAEILTGVPSGFDQHDFNPRGGLYASDAYTGGTFTLKSIVASVCGANPLVVDFNREFFHHIYQPCMPHIFNTLNKLSPALPKNSTKSTDSKDFKSWPWRSTMMQSITDDYDNQDRLTPAMGFDDKVTDKTITKDFKKKPGPNPEKYNFWGYEEHKLREYFLDALIQAEKKHERVFLTHLTGQTHHPWKMPIGEEYEALIASGLWNKNDKVNRYLNTIGVNDKWLGEVMDLLNEAGVADETLVVMVGDHGISLLEDGGVTPNDNPHVKNFHVPLVFSHPSLPPITLNNRISSLQILPTILDLLVQSSSLDAPSAKAIQDLLPLYEGQSMIREPVPEAEGKQDWQFTVMNTGGTWLALRSAAKPYRLVVPLVPDVEWRFSDVSSDPIEERTLQSFNLKPLLKDVGNVHGEAAAEWVGEAAHVAQWWVAENWRRWEYLPEN